MKNQYIKIYLSPAHAQKAADIKKYFWRTFAQNRVEFGCADVTKVVCTDKEAGLALQEKINAFLSTEF